MKESSRNLWVGVFVVASLGSLSVLMIWFGEAPSWLRQSEWTLRITGVQALQGVGDGSVVKLNGVEIGRVQKVEFAESDRPDLGVVIVAGIKREHMVPKGAVANVYGAMLGIGGGRIEITVKPGQETIPIDKEHAEIHGVMKSLVGDLISTELIGSVQRAIANIGDLTHEWTPVGSNLSKMLEQRKVKDIDAAEGGDLSPNLTTVVERLDELIRNFNAVLGDANVQSDVRTVVTTVKATSEEFKKLVELWQHESQRLADGFNDGVHHADANFSNSFRKLNKVLENLDQASDDLAHLSQQLSAGGGTIGLLSRDPRLYESAVLSFDRFGQVLENLAVITGKIKEDGYIRVSTSATGFPYKDFKTPGGAHPAR